MYIQVGHRLNTSSAVVWRVITDTHDWVRWGPSIIAVACDERFIRSGSRGRIQTVFGFWVPFMVTAYEHGQYWHWHVGGIPATGHRVESLAAERCRLVFEVPVWAAPYAIVCQRAQRQIARLLAL